MKKIIFKSILISFLFYYGCVVIPRGYIPISSSEDEMIYKRVDNIDNRTFYRHKSFFQDFFDSDRKMLSPIEVYIAESESFRILRIKFYYAGYNWIFFDRATIINLKGQRMVFNFNTFDKTTTVVSANLVRERIDELLPAGRGSELLELLNNNGTVKVRLAGKYSRDYELTDKQISGLKTMLTMYFENT